MAEQDLHHSDVDPLLEQPGGVAVAERVRGDMARDSRSGGCGPKGRGDHVGGDRSATFTVGKQPARMPMAAPQQPKLRESRLRQRDAAIPAAPLSAITGRQ